MSEVLVVVEHGEGAVTKPTLELLTLARRMGDPVAVVFGDAGSDRDPRHRTGQARCWSSTIRPSSSIWWLRRRKPSISSPAIGSRPPS